MKLLYSSLLSLVGLAIAAPHSVRQDEQVVPFPPADEMLKPLSWDEAVAIMEVPADSNSTIQGLIAEAAEISATSDGEVSTMAGCRNDIRKRWANMSGQERSNFVGAIRCLMNARPKGIGMPGARSVYDELAWVHYQMTNDIHSVDLFLPFHRYYLWAFKTLLSEQCGFNGPIPWWREPNNIGNFGASDIFSTAYFGTLPQRDGNGNARCVNNGLLTGLTEVGTRNCVGRGEDRGVTGQVTFANEDLCHGNEGNTFPQHARCVEGRNHVFGHNGVGSTMSRPNLSPSDPIFFMHHSYIDWQWKRWQNVASWRWTTISGCADKRSPCTPLTRDTRLHSMGLVREVTVGDILDTEGPFACYTYDDLL